MYTFGYIFSISSKKINDELISAKSECNGYTDSMLSNISSITIDYVDTLPATGDSSTIYILKSADSTSKDTLNLYNNGTWTNIGDFEIGLEEYYKKSEIDSKLDLKADKTEILSQDNVIVDTTQATTTNVLSSITILQELDKKIDKTNIVTSVDDTVTDEQVPSAKAVYDNIKNTNIKTYTTLEQLGLTEPVTVGDIYNILPEKSIFVYGTAISRVTDVPTSDGLGILIIEKDSPSKFNITFKPSGSGAVKENILYLGQLKGSDGSGLVWSKVCTTSVTDIPQTALTYNDTTNYKPESTNIGYGYRVLNGICYLQAYVRVVSSSDSPITICNLPKPEQGVRGVASSWTNNDSSVLGIKYGVYTEDSTLRIWDGESGQAYMIRTSYPVAEN